MHPPLLCVLFMHKLPGSVGVEVVIYRVLNGKGWGVGWRGLSSVFTCVCVALHVKQDKRGCIFEISVCDFMFVFFYFFLLNALPRLRYGFD